MEWNWFMSIDWFFILRILVLCEFFSFFNVDMQLDIPMSLKTSPPKKSIISTMLVVLSM